MNVPAQIAQILVRPGRPDLAIQPRLRVLAVPAEPEAVAIGAGGGFERPHALRNQGMRRRGDVMLKRDALTPIGDPAAHAALSWGPAAGAKTGRSSEIGSRGGKSTPDSAGFRASHQFSSHAPNECGADGVVPYRAHQRAAKPCQPPAGIIAVDPARRADIRDGSDRADQLELDQAGQEQPSGEPLILVGQQVVEREIPGDRVTWRRLAPR